MLIVDTGPLVSIADRDDPHYQRSDVREENSVSTSCGMSAISAMPFSGRFQRTPDRVVSSARSPAW